MSPDISKQISDKTFSSVTFYHVSWCIPKYPSLHVHTLWRQIQTILFGYTSLGLACLSSPFPTISPFTVVTLAVLKLLVLQMGWVVPRFHVLVETLNQELLSILCS